MDLSDHIAEHRQQAEIICQRLNAEIDKLGFAAGEIKLYPSYDEASFVLVKDPYTGDHNLSCYWYNKANSQRVGRLQFNSGGSFYAEFDVVKAHPSKAKWFVEGVTAWGNTDNIKSEAKLIPIA